MLLVLRQVFSQFRYIVIAIITSIVVFQFAGCLANFRLIIKIIFNSSALVLEKISLLFSLFCSIQTNFSIISASYTIIIAILFGINIALLVYYVRNKQMLVFGSGATLSVGGLISGMFGIGCATCGTFILTSALALIGVGGIITFLPFGGEEFGIFGIVLIIYATYYIAKKIKEPLIC